MRNNKGFTLLELLVAATIVGIMAVFATVSYKNSAADARIAASKARTEALAGAVQRYNLEHSHLGTQQMSLSLLNDYIDKYDWNSAHEYVVYYVCNEKKEGACSRSPVDNPLACMKGKELSKLPKRYQGKADGSAGYIYCVSAEGTGEKLGS